MPTSKETNAAESSRFLDAMRRILNAKPEDVKANKDKPKKSGSKPPKPKKSD